MAWVRSLTALVLACFFICGAGAHTITADMNVVAGSRDMFWQDSVSITDAATFLRPDAPERLKFLREAIGFHYVHLQIKPDTEETGFATDIRITTVLLKSGFKPFYAIHAVENTDKTSLKNLTTFIRRLETQFGAEQVQSWRFEIQDSSVDFTAYAATAHALRIADEKIPVGGPGTADRLPDFLSLTQAAGVSPDFITLHAYGTPPDSRKLSADPHAIVSDIWRVRAIAARAGLPDIPVFLTEWALSDTAQSEIRDSYFNAAYILEKLKGAENFVQSMSYRTAYDDAGEPFHGGYGLITQDNILKPAFFAFKYLSALGQTRLKTRDTHSWVAKDGNAASALIWNFHLPDQKGSTPAFATDDHPALKMQPITLRLKNLIPGTYRLKSWRTGYRENDPLTNYIRWGEPSSLTGAQKRILLRETSDRPYSSETIEVHDDGIFSKQFRLRENDILLVKLTPVAE